MRFMIGVLLLSMTQSATAKELKGTPIRFTGNITEPEDVSGIAFVGRSLFICADEAADLDVLEKNANDEFKRSRSITLSNATGEIDMEGLAADGDTLYVIGSHSLNRKDAEPGRTREKNLERIATVEHGKERDQLIRVKLNGTSDDPEIDSISLRKLLEKDKILDRFCNIPSKENGIDIEGIAIHDGKLLLGCRGPVLRDNFVPVIVLDFDDPKDYQLRFVQLDGNGIRDVAAVQDGFLLISGPVGDGAGPYGLHFWDGEDCLPGKDVTPGTVTLLGEIPAGEGKAEGVCLVEETDSEYRVIIVFDGIKNGSPTAFTVQKP